jgi:diphthamide biosynthesis enzyme Dph1/Dph2-like protein
MKKIFIPLIEKLTIKKGIIEKINRELPKNIAVFYTIQYKNFAKKILNKIKSKQITKFSQILGCSNPKLPKETEAILLIGEGGFHANSLAYESKKNVYLLEKENLRKINKEEIEKLEKKEKTALVNFLNNDRIGVLIANKPGQARLQQALETKNKIKKKKIYFFLANEVNSKEFENFGLKSWVNTACPRIDLEDNKIMNLNNILKIQKLKYKTN